MGGLVQKCEHIVVIRFKPVWHYTVVGIAQLIELNDIYGVNIRALPSQNWIDVSNIQAFSPEEFRFNWGQISETIPSIKGSRHLLKLMLLGKPGSGKTTFCNISPCNVIKVSCYQSRSRFLSD